MKDESDVGFVPSYSSFIPSLRRIDLFAAVLFHHHAIAQVVKLDAGHECPHEHDSTAGRDFDVLLVGTIGNVIGSEAWTFVLNAHPQPLWRHAAEHVHVLGGIRPIAVANGVDERLLERQVDAVDIVLRPIVGFELFEDFVENLTASACLAGDPQVEVPRPVQVFHGLARLGSAGLVERQPNRHRLTRNGAEPARGSADTSC